MFVPKRNNKTLSYIYVEFVFYSDSFVHLVSGISETSLIYRQDKDWNYDAESNAT